MRNEDEKVKPELYARIGVREYFIFDPEDTNRPQRLKGFRWKARKFARQELAAGGRLSSRRPQLVLEPEGHLLRLFDPRTGQRILTGEEQEDAVEAARQETEQARREADIHRRRAAALEAELARLRPGGKRSDA